MPTWAYMLVAQKLSGVACEFVFGNLETLETMLMNKKLAAFDPEEYAGKPVVIKGCFDKPVPVSAYVEITRLLVPHVKSIMYGEACSSVPIFKRKV